MSVVTQLWLAWAGLVGKRSWAGSGQPEPDIGIQLRQMSQDSDPCFQGNCFLESAWMQLSTGLHHLTASHSAEQLGKRWGRHGGRACCFCSHIHTHTHLAVTWSSWWWINRRSQADTCRTVAGINTHPHRLGRKNKLLFVGWWDGRRSICVPWWRGRWGVIKDSLLIRSQQRLARRERKREDKEDCERRDIVRGSDIHREGQRQISGLARG